MITFKEYVFNDGFKYLKISNSFFRKEFANYCLVCNDLELDNLNKIDLSAINYELVEYNEDLKKHLLFNNRSNYLYYDEQFIKNLLLTDRQAIKDLYLSFGFYLQFPNDVPIRDIVLDQFNTSNYNIHALLLDKPLQGKYDKELYYLIKDVLSATTTIEQDKDLDKIIKYLRYNDISLDYLKILSWCVGYLNPVHSDSLIQITKGVVESWQN